MKKTISLLAFLVLIINLSQAQDIKQDQNIPFIEVTGFAEKLVIPDEIYLTITIEERESGRDKATVEQQEEELKNALQSMNIPLENLSVSHARADYIQVSWLKKDVVSRNKYELKVATAEQLAAMLEKLDGLDIENAYISHVSHSEITELRKETRIMAIKAAKEKADYLLEAIGQKTGKALLITENPEYVNTLPTRNVINREALSKKFNPTQENVFGKKAVQFEKIRVQSVIYVKFEIE